MRIVSFFRKLKSREHGFTIAEMLVAVLVFGLLVAIAVPVYLNQRSQGDQTSLKADLINASVNVEQSKVDNGGVYPSSLPNGIVLQTAGAQLKYSHPYDRLSYCLQITAGTTTYFKSNADTAPNSVDCTFDYTLPSTVLRGTMPNNGYAPLLSWKAVRGATTYNIFQDNVKVFTYNVSAAEVNNLSFSQSLPNMSPAQTSVFYVVVGDGATTSAQSNTVSLTAPTPPPSAVTAKIIGSDVASPTQQIYTISWNAVQWAQSYEVWDSVANQRIAQIPGGTTSFQYKNTRGTSTSVIVRAVNPFGTSPDSNTLNLSSSWAKPVILSAVSNPANGTIAFQWQTGTSPSLTPDWGTPGYSVKLTVTNATTSQVYTYTGITTPTYTPVDSYQRTTHTASIIVTTATGVTLQSDPVTIQFPPPPAPAAVTGFTSDGNGTSVIKNNRLVWNAVTCTQSSSPQYLITKLDNSMGNPNSGWITGTNWNIPDAQLAQSVVENYQIQANCVNGNGASNASPAVQTTFTTGILTPPPPANLKNDHNFVVSWDAVTCATGINAQYTLSQTKKNGAVVSNTFVTTNTSQTFTDLTPGTDQSVSVMARCAKFGSYPDPSTITASSSWSNYSSPTSWTTLLPAPAAPVLTLVQSTVFSPTQMDNQISWNSVQWAQTYDVFDAANPGTPLTTVGNATTSVSVKTTRGTTMNVYVRAKNTDATGANSNTVALSNSWPTPVILSSSSDPYAGNITLSWQNGTDTAPTPDWGTPGYKVQVNVKNLTTGQTYTYPNIAARSFTTTDTYQRVDHSVSITVTTATGATLNSAAITVSFPPPGPPAAVTGLSSNGNGVGPVKNDQLVWNAANCGAATPQYLITNTTGGQNSGWIAGTVSGSTVSWNITQAWLSQGVNESFTVAARCTNPNGASSPSPTPDASVSFKTSIVTPPTPTNLVNNGVDTISWDATTTCAAGTTPYYNVVQTVLNGNPVNNNLPTANTTLKLTGLSPATTQTLAVQARCQITSTSTYSTYSALTPTTSWTTPVPAPAAPVITAGSVTNASPTQADFVINWTTVQWASTYEVHDAASGVLIQTVSSPATTTTVRLTRGTSKNVVVNAVNVTGTSPNSNTLTLSTTWPTPVILTSNSQLDGTINFAWQTGTSPNYTPDWGTPGYSVVLKVTRVRDGLVAYTSPSLTTSGVLTPAMPSREDYTAQITVTTATGTVLTSAPVTVTFPKPAAPAAPTGLASDALGTGPIKNDRLTWNAVTCPTSGSTAYYYVSITSPTGKPAGTWQTSNVFNIPQAWLTQGDTFTFQLLAKCNNANGDSTQPAPVTTTFTTGILAPNTPTNFRTGGTASVFWDAASCGTTGYTPEYQIVQTMLNDAASNLVYTTTSTSYALPNINAGANQSATIAARCDKTTTPTGNSAWSAASAALNWRAPLPQPGAPTVTLGSSSVISPTQVTFNISWGAVQYAENYEIHDAADNSIIATVPSTTTVYGVTTTRGVDRTVYVKAVNFSAGSVNSNSVTFSSPWATPVITSAQSNTSGQMNFVWQTGTSPNYTPDWGNPGYKVDLQVTRVSDGYVYNYTGLTVPSYTPSTVYNRERHTATITVTTATGVKMTSAAVTIDFVFAKPPTADVTNFASNASGPGPTHNDVLTWTAVTCPTAGSTAQYDIKQTTPANDSGWFAGTSFTVPQAWIQQGVSYTFNITARCIDGNGPSLTTTNPVAQTFTTTINTPAAPAGLVNDNQSTLTWNAVTCPSNLVAGYQVTMTKQNGVVGNWVYAVGTNTTYTIAGLTPDTDQVATVQAKCYVSTNTAMTSAWSAQATATSWHIPLPVPVAPVNLHINSTTLSPTQATFNVGWNSVQWAASYTVYNANTMAILGTVNSPTTSMNVVTARGKTVNIMVRAANVSGSSPNSNTVTLDSSWPTPVIQSAVGNADGTVTLTYQTGTSPNYSPDWGNPGYSVKANLTHNGTSNYYQPQQVGTGFDVYGKNLIATGDANKDGKPDIYGFNPNVNSGAAYYYEGDGGNLNDASPFYAPRYKGPGWNIFDVVISGADFNGDGISDYIGRKPGDGSLWLYSGYWDGGISSSVNIGQSGWNVYTTLFTGDFNKDGKGDIMGIKSDGTMWFYAGNGASGLAAGVQVGSGWGIYSQVINAGDVNKDGINDIIGVKSDGTAYLYYGNGTNYVSGPIKQIASGWNIYDKILGGGDYNGDGDPDILARKPDGTLWLIPGPVDTGAIGAFTYTSPAVSGPSITTAVMPITDSYSATITVTTATGDVLTSAPVNVTWPLPAAPTAGASSPSSNANGSSPVAKNNRVQWTAGTCAAGSWPEYNVIKDRKNGTLGTYGNSGWVTGTIYDYRDDMLEQGSQMSAVIQTRCTNEAGSSAPFGSTVYTIWTTSVDAPAASATITNNGWGTVRWSTVSCPPNTTPTYRAVQDVKDGANNQTFYPWQTGTSQDVSYTQGYPQKVHNDAKCVGPNAESSVNWNANTSWTSAINPPTGLRVEAGGSWCGYRTACWTATCPSGLTPHYTWAVRNTSGADIWANYNWSNTATSYSNTSVSWGNGTVWEWAACMSPYTNGPQAGLSNTF